MENPVADVPRNSGGYGIDMGIGDNSIITKDRTKWIEIEEDGYTHPTALMTRRIKRREKRFLCVNGPLTGAHRARYELRDVPGYFMFNDAKGDTEHSAVWVFL